MEVAKITRVCIVVTISIQVAVLTLMPSPHVAVNESFGFVEVCVKADHESMVAFEVFLITEDVTARGRNLATV